MSIEDLSLQEQCQFFVDSIKTSNERANIAKKNEKIYREISNEVFCLCDSLNIKTEKTFYIDQTARWEMQIKKDRINGTENDQTIYKLSLIKNDYDQNGGKIEKYDFATIMENAVTTNIESHIDKDFSWEKSIKRAELVRKFVKHIVDRD